MPIGMAIAPHDRAQTNHRGTPGSMGPGMTRDRCRGACNPLYKRDILCARGGFGQYCTDEHGSRVQVCLFTSLLSREFRDMSIPSPLPGRADDGVRWAPSAAGRSRRTTIAPAQPSRAKPPRAHGALEGLDPSLRGAMLAAVPRLRRSAMALSGQADRADDLVQETLLRGMTAIESFRPGSNMAAWLTTIMRNLYRSEQRKRRREVEDPEGRHIASLVSPPGQESCMALEEFRMALGKVPSLQREALILVGAFGFTYAEAGAACGAAAGTVKSRVHRARTLLSGLLCRESPAASGQA